ncbi:LOW QUALITY PROTEIN: hypothetical protein TorRG33x02_088960 [Trema orientale]|uniref:Uncharacterized protein n=1 Tax=Trema orientale TaxID=63057 RepID=A0A2P5FC57_TREOI|nr:LOW QUALITY PROTEIN: hypothetical protein TorRG33x02_088960 [Trema orientale]
MTWFSCSVNLFSPLPHSKVNGKRNGAKRPPEVRLWTQKTIRHTRNQISQNNEISPLTPPPKMLCALRTQSSLRLCRR